MNRKHLIQFVATLGAMLVLYVLSFAPVYLFVGSRHGFLATNGLYHGFYSPAVAVFRNSAVLEAAHRPYFDWWVNYFQPSER